MTLADAIHSRTWVEYFEFWPTWSELDITEKQNSFAGRAMAADKAKFCFKTSLPLENSSREKLILQSLGRMFRCLTTEHRPHSTCPAHSYQQPDPTATLPPPPTRRGQLCRADVTNFTAQPNFGDLHKTFGLSQTASRFAVLNEQ